VIGAKGGTADHVFGVEIGDKSGLELGRDFFKGKKFLDLSKVARPFKSLRGLKV
jgi:hypothetical protein